MDTPVHYILKENAGTRLFSLKRKRHLMYARAHRITCCSVISFCFTPHHYKEHSSVISLSMNLLGVLTTNENKLACHS